MVNVTVCNYVTAVNDMKNGIKVLPMILIVLFMFSVSISKVSAQEMTIQVVPNVITIPQADIGEEFTVNITVTNVPALPEPKYGAAGWEFKLTWNVTLLNATSNVILPSDHFMLPKYDSNIDNYNLFVMINETNNEEGFAWGAILFIDLNRSITLGYGPKTGSGTLAQIKFISKTWGKTSLHFLEKDPVLPDVYITQIGDYEGERIPCTIDDGEVNILPEFPMPLLLSIFMLVTFAAIVITKKARLRKVSHSS